jgi:hypothetical protein
MPKPTIQLEYHAPNARIKVRVRNVTPTELDRLYHDGLIARDLHDAGEAALRDLWKAKMLGPAAVDYNHAGGGGDPQPMSSGRAKALKRVNQWLEDVDREAGQEARRLLLSVLCDDKAVSTMAGVVIIRQALAATVRHHEARRKTSPLASLMDQAFSSLK